METILAANNAKKDILVKGNFAEVVRGFSEKKGVEIYDCRIDPNYKNKTLYMNGINMYTIVHPDNIK